MADDAIMKRPLLNTVPWMRLLGKSSTGGLGTKQGDYLLSVGVSVYPYRTRDNRVKLLHKLTRDKKHRMYICRQSHCLIYLSTLINRAYT